VEVCEFLFLPIPHDSAWLRALSNNMSRLAESHLHFRRLVHCMATKLELGARTLSEGSLVWCPLRILILDGRSSITDFVLDGTVY
jgi:hypothetical protein